MKNKITKLNDFDIHHRFYASLILLTLDVVVQLLWFKSNLVANICAMVVLLCTASLIAYKAKRPNLKVIIVGVPVIIAILAIVAACFGAIRSTNQAILETQYKHNLFKAFIFTVVIAPIFEESIFRLTMINFTTPKKLAFTSIVSWLLFTIIHLYNSAPILFLQYGAISFVLTAAYVKTRNITDSLSIHVIYNLLCFIMLLT